MTPFGRCLEKLRRKRGLQQSQIAVEVGIQSCYVSAVENGRKGPPSPQIIDKIITILDLNSDEESELRATIASSKKSRQIPANTSCQEYLLVDQLWRRLGSLTENQVQLILLALKTTEEMGGRKHTEI